MMPTHKLPVAPTRMRAAGLVVVAAGLVTSMGLRGCNTWEASHGGVLPVPTPAQIAAYEKTPPTPAQITAFMTTHQVSDSQLRQIFPADTALDVLLPGGPGIVFCAQTGVIEAIENHLTVAAVGRC